MRGKLAAPARAACARWMCKRQAAGGGRRGQSCTVGVVALTERRLPRTWAVCATNSINPAASGVNEARKDVDGQRTCICKSVDEPEASDAVQIRRGQRAFRSQVRSPITSQAQGSPANFKLRWARKSICQLEPMGTAMAGRCGNQQSAQRRQPSVGEDASKVWPRIQIERDQEQETRDIDRCIANVAYKRQAPDFVTLLEVIVGRHDFPGSLLPGGVIHHLLPGEIRQDASGSNLRDAP
ncbi:hypothetical protein GGX14DRAFT_400873 [Mycena pura]|uniref:Uncharacterized protein n=1 Tax=Mycena pura TaxID=153505 RepID=A0AAD6V416_9AGAR|nr:hypothetical protein GGX14DRAFT_400873 [Mycena pura]